MKCARCSAEIPTQSQFCLRCGTPIHAAASPSGPVAPSPFAPLPSARRNPLLPLAILLGLAVLGLGAFVVRGQFLQKSGQSDNGRLVSAPGQASGGTLVQAPGEAKPTQMVQAPAQAPPVQVVQQPGEAAPYPADIDDYLKFLKQIETQKQTLIHKELGDALEMMVKAKGLSGSIEGSDYNSAVNDIGKGITFSANDWNQLTAQFNQRTPPDSCRDLHDKYYDHLGKIQGMIVAVNDALSKVQSDPSGALHALTQMQGKASADADAAINAADDALGDICNRYRLKKDFDIKGDNGSAGMFR